MSKNLIVYSLLFLSMTLLVSCKTMPKYKKVDATMSVLDFSNVIPAEEFQKNIKDAGGFVDFAFGKDKPFEQAHASTVEQTDNGTIVVAWFGGSHEKAPDVGIWSSYYKEGKWSYPKLVAKVNETAHWNPVLFKDNKGKLFLFFKVGAEISQWQTYVMTSDDGINWTKPDELVKGDVGGRGPVKNQPITLSNGTWIAPASQEVTGWKAFVDISRDNGKTWKQSEIFGGPVVENGRVKCFKRAGFINNLTPEQIRKAIDAKDMELITESIDPKAAVFALVNDGVNIRVNRIPEDPKALKKMSEGIEWSNIYNKTINKIIQNVNKGNIKGILKDTSLKEIYLNGIYSVFKDSLTNGPIQPALWESGPGKVHALMRTPFGSLWRIDSEDYGKTWCNVYDTGIPNNNSGVDLVKLDNGKIILILNPVSQNWGPRTPLTLMISSNNGLTWRAVANLEDEGAYLGDQEFSYPTIIKAKDGGVIISYTWKRNDVRIWKIPAKVIDSM